MNKLKVNILKCINLTIFILTVIFLVILTIASALFSSVYKDKKVEYSSIIIDNVPILIILSIVFILALYFIYRFIASRVVEKEYKVIVGFSVFIFLLSLFFATIFANKIQMFDAKYILDLAKHAASNDYGYVVSSYHVQSYPRLLGLIFFEEIIFRIFGPENNNVFYILTSLNCIFITLIYVFLYKLTDLLFNNKKILIIFSLLFISFLPLTIMSHFIYGLIPMITFGVMAIYYQSKFLDSIDDDRHKNDNRYIKYAILSVLSITLAVLLKQNSLIILVAMLLLYLYRLIKKPNIFIILVAAFSIFCSLASPLVIEKLYEKRSGMEIGAMQVPTTAWLVMGLQSTPKYVSSSGGWFNNYVNGTMTPTTDQKNVVNKDLANELKKYIDNPMDSIKFFAKKFVSSWTNPDFGCFVYQDNIRNGGDMSTIAKAIIYGDSSKVFYWFMNVVHFVIALFALLCFIFKYKKKFNMELYILGIVILGGLLYHILFEAKDQYILPYYVMLIPYAAFGIYESFRLLETKLKKNI